VKAKYTGIIFIPALKLSFRFKTAYFVIRNMQAAQAPEMNGAMTQEARITPNPSHPQVTPLVPRTATPTPTTDPTIL
jgi:hypothetical protein